MDRLRLIVCCVLFCVLQQQSRAGSVCCPGLSFCFSDDLPFDDRPLPECAETQGIVMKVYTRNNPKEGQLITRNYVPSVFNGDLLTMFIVHGWLQNENYVWMHDMKDAALQKGDFNVIIVGWSIGALRLNYFQSASNTRAVGAEIALVSNLTIQTTGSSRSRQYCVGHSLGSHVCGHAGHSGQFGRITGLDPAGPAFDDRPPSVGLDQTSADLVDVIHTNYPSLLVFGLGAFRPLGHIDFYPNGGSQQPGCTVDPFGGIVNPAGIFTGENSSLKIAIEVTLGCNHIRAYQFFTESILEDCFWSRDVICTNPSDLPGSCKSNGTVLQSLGFHANTYPGRGIFYLKTNPSSPFCRH